MAIIGLSLSNEHLSHVDGESRAFYMWQALLDIFERQTLLNRLRTRRNFYSVKMSPANTVLAFINHIRRLSATLHSMGVTIDDQEMDMAALNGLPERFYHLISDLDALGNEENRILLLYLVKSRLLQEEQRFNLSAENISSVQTDSAIVTSSIVLSSNIRPK